MLFRSLLGAYKEWKSSIHNILKFFCSCFVYFDVSALHLSRLALNIYEAGWSENTLIIFNWSISYAIKCVMPFWMTKTGYKLWLAAALLTLLVCRHVPTFIKLSVSEGDFSYFISNPFVSVYMLIFRMVRTT